MASFLEENGNIIFWVILLAILIAGGIYLVNLLTGNFN
jgi:hypothetical protein